MAKFKGEGIIDDIFTAKQDHLVDAFNVILQNFLKDKISLWEEDNNIDFFATLLAQNQGKKRKWNKDEEKVIKGRNVDKWDTTICAKILIEAKLEPPLAISFDEKEEIKKLKNLRNNTKHRVAGCDITSKEFIKNCKLVSKALEMLGTPKETIEAIIEEASGKTIINKVEIEAHINMLRETDWNFETLRVLGSGFFGIVIHAKSKTDSSPSAIKLVFDKRFGARRKEYEEECERDLREAVHWAKLAHPNVVKYKTSGKFEFWPDKIKEILDIGNESKGKIGKYLETLHAIFHTSNESKRIISGLYIQTEICGDTLRIWLNDRGVQSTATSEFRGRICLHISRGVDYIHSQNLIHRDLRPENIFFRDGRELPIKIGDFGLSVIPRDQNQFETMTKEVGNVLYRAPEMDEPHPEKDGKAKYNLAVDYYAMGLIISEIYDPKDVGQLRNKFSNIRYLNNTGSNIKINHPKIDELIIRLCQNDAEERMGCLPIDSKIFVQGPTPNNSPRRANQQDSEDEIEEDDDEDAAILNGMETIRLVDINLLQSPSISGSTPNDDIGPIQVDSGNGSGLNSPVQSPSIFQDRVRAQIRSASSTSNPYRSQQSSRPIVQEQSFPSEDQILRLRKMLQSKNKEMWKGRNLANFLNHLEGKPNKHNAQNFPTADSGLRTHVNKILYTLYRSNRLHFTKTKLKTAFINSGFPDLAEQVDLLLMFA